MAKDSTRRRWVKIWHEILTDESFQDLSLSQQARFYNLLVYTSAHGDKGEMTITDPSRILVGLLQCDSFFDMIKKINQVSSQNRNLRIKEICNGENPVTYSVAFQKWHKYQIDDSSERVGRFRRNVTVQEEEKEKEKDKDIKTFIDYAFQCFLEQTGERLCVDGKKDGAIVKKLLAVYGLEKLKELWGHFMQSDDSFIRTAGKSIGVFKSQINKLLLQKTKKDWRE